MGFDRGRTAPFAMRFSSRDGNGRTEISGLALTLGALDVKGTVQLASGGKPGFTARLHADRLDWLKALADAGGKVRPRHHDEQIYHPDPVAWHALGLLGGLDGKADLDVGWLKLANGLELEHVKAKATMGGGTLQIEPFAAAMLGGSATGSFRFDAPKKAIRAKLDGEKLLLEQWFAQRGSKIPFKGGPMTLHAALTLTGATFRELAASVTGPVSLRMGKGTWDSKRAGEAEEMMVSALAPRGADSLTFECAAAKLDFRDGRANGKRLLGARTEASQLLTSGTVDFREETLDLRGRVQARKGMSLGLANLAAGVQITGKLARPHMGMDPDEKPALLARAAAAIASSGATLVGEALFDAANKADACDAVFK
jgi:AsmA family protein